jgi:hypothetical protein
MRSLKSRLLGYGAVAVFGIAVVVGCSASGDTGDLTQAAPTEPTDNGGKQLGQSAPSTDQPSTTDNSTDGTEPEHIGSSDGGPSTPTTKDAGPSAPDPGQACPTIDYIFKRTCGVCGSQEARCFANDAGTGGFVGPYNDCHDEKVGGCVAGSTDEVACGDCGTAKRTCNKACVWTQSSCAGQPTNHCTPGAIELTNASCSGNTFSQRTCSGTCSWSYFSQTCSPPPTFVAVPPSVGSTNSAMVQFTSTKTTARLPSYYYTCPITAAFTTATPYTYMEVRNTNPKAVTVTISNSTYQNGPAIYGVRAVYAGSAIPTSDSDRKNCKDNKFTTGTFTTTMTGISIPANSSVQVYMGAYDAYDPTDPTDSTGTMMFNVKTESVAP